MASSSSSTRHHIIDDEDDDEGFDWEAAVREIDVACAQTTTNSAVNTKIIGIPTPNVSDFREPHKTFMPGKGNSFSSSSRQSTLDRFTTRLASTSNRPQREKEENFRNGFCKNENNSYGGIGKGENEGMDAEGRASFVKIDMEAAKTWIYPVNIPRRDYQFNITRSALFSNTLVALPTGLGKTLIAAVVMYNYFRWFPEGKIVFAAPSRPLVLQQIEACHNVVGIPQEWAIDLTGQTNPTKRAHYWKTKRVFFVTPQVLEKDIYSGSCLVKNLVCLVIDEAHRATGNYSYCVVVRELMAVPVELRILALTATPGSKQQSVQHIINNLQISRLEYRSESDPDVRPYVHDRKIELIEVAMGNDAVEVNDFILEAIQPYIVRLGAIGVLPSRDFQTLSPCDLLNSRDKFREAPPGNLPQMKYGEIEGYFGVLITLYHIRKLLSSHGIKPAFEMLQEKLQQGSFARLMSRNENLLKAKLVMQQNISHGAPSPKLSKMLEVLSNHFTNKAVKSRKTLEQFDLFDSETLGLIIAGVLEQEMKNPLDSRVIIFSNFRGSVRDIMLALKSLGEYVKATEFIGQSSGKTSKGQSQKVQQAVLEKFRAGGYNVIVATSIGEEGLDIMEVDLVICFDANISPLRMIQRMGRTGRKNEGRVVVLACEGSELKGYMRKQANSKAIRKHMQNGGTKSFQFHSSPRMVPHILKPDVQFVELSIEQFIPRVKKVNDNCPIDSPTYKAKLNDAEKSLVAKYFCPSKENAWGPSLIAFPHFQAFPSRVGTVVHSSRTGMLIDTMQCLQGLSFPGDTKAFPIEDRATPELLSVSEAVDQCNDMMTELRSPMTSPEENIVEVSDAKVESKGNINTKREPYLQDSERKNSTHCFLFDSEFIALDDLGRVLVSSFLEFPPKEISVSKPGEVSKTTLLYHLKEASVNLDTSTNLGGEKNEQVKDASASHVIFEEDGKDLTCEVNNIFNTSQEHTLVQICQSPISKQRSNGGENICISPPDRTPLLFNGEDNEDSREFELSPRLSNFLECGIVPESPPILSGRPSIKGDEFEVPDLVSTHGMHSELVVKSPEQSEGRVQDILGNEINGQCSLMNEIRILPVSLNEVSLAFKTTSPTVEESESPLINSLNKSCSKDWQLNSVEKSECVEQKHKLKRLRKLGDLSRNRLEDLKEHINGSKNFIGFCLSSDHVRNHCGRGKKQKVNDAKVFVEEEAEVSSDVGTSTDEEDELDNNSYDDTFIDDRLNPTLISTQAEAGAIDMMAVYRRSLLSQSPLARKPHNGADFTPSTDEVPRTDSTSISGTESHLAQKSFNGLESTARNATSSRLNRDRECSDPHPTASPRTGFAEEYVSKIENHKKRKFYQPGSLPIHNLEQEFFAQSAASGKDPILEEDKFQENVDIFDDDQFYNAIDLDAIEEEATKLLKHRAECSTQKQVLSSEPVPLNTAIPGSSPSFDLGI